LIQHYGGKTRLLDFTRSFYIALFFALQSSSGKENNYDQSAIWCINYYRDSLNEFLEHGGVKHYSDNRFNEIFKKYQESQETEFNQILVLDPKNITKRMRVQNGLFLFGGNFGYTFEENLYQVDTEKALIRIKKDSHKVNVEEFYTDKTDRLKEIIIQSRVIKIVIPSHLRGFLFSELNQMNINFKILFPDLQGLMNHIYR